MIPLRLPSARPLFLACTFACLILACSGSDADDGDDGSSSSSGGTTSGDGDAPGDGDGDGDGVGDGDATGDGDVSGDGDVVFDADRSRVVGYLPTYRSLDPLDYDFSVLTHLCIAFANEIGASSVDFDASDEEITGIVEAAHDDGVRVLASIAGAAGGPAVENAIQPGSVDNYVASLVALVSRHNLDGIDVDIEGNHVSPATYDPFIAKLRAALPTDKLITVAVATWNGDDFPDAALATFDFINLMSYDHCGSWSANPCDHSSYADSLDELSYWENDRGIPADKMVLGVPFYGYCWGTACPASALTHAEIIAYPQGAESDYFSGDGFTISHNTAATIGQKADLAKMHGGIMIWELGQDASGEDSLLQVIADHQ